MNRSSTNTLQQQSPNLANQYPNQVKIEHKIKDETQEEKMKNEDDEEWGTRSIHAELLIGCLYYFQLAFFSSVLQATLFLYIEILAMCNPKSATVHFKSFY